MEDISEDREDRRRRQRRRRKPRTKTAPEDSDRRRAAADLVALRPAGARAGLDLLGTVFALARSLSPGRGPPSLATAFAVLGVWAASSRSASSVVRPARWSRLITEGDATRCVLALALLVLACRRDASAAYAVVVGVIVA